jgi:hypothetical protein
VRTHGWRTGPPEILAQLSDPALADNVDPNSYKFRIFIEMETGDERYRDKVNCGMWVGSGMRKGAEVVYEWVVYFGVFEFVLMITVLIGYHSIIKSFILRTYIHFA